MKSQRTDPKLLLLLLPGIGLLTVTFCHSIGLSDSLTLLLQALLVCAQLALIAIASSRRDRGDETAPNRAGER
ncbi:hypothetical protein [Streptomyces sp. URMC 123]|uniref:hypothetical protein n=1 Tax=Streptomyces sp. URMC 123 TaxID=3423403 RepID=UPI003F1C94DB